jgi:hypothetical protein
MAVAIGLVVIGLGFIVDVTTGRDLSLSLVYVAGVSLMVWTGSVRWACSERSAPRWRCSSTASRTRSGQEPR